MGRSGIRRRKPRRRLPKVGTPRTPPPSETTPVYIYDPRLGGQFLLGPAALGSAMEHGTRAQKRRAWFFAGIIGALVLASIAVWLVSNIQSS